MNEISGLQIANLTHDLDMLVAIADRVIALSAGRVIADGPVHAVRKSGEPWLQEYFASRA